MTDRNEACCTIPPIVSDYQPKGTWVDIGDLKCYSIGPTNSEKAILMIYDIFGIHATTQQVADLLSSAGFRVLMPDFYKGNPWVTVPIDFPKLLEHIKQHVDNETFMKPRIDAICKQLVNDGAKSIYGLGFCWGASEIIKANCTSKKAPDVSMKGIAGVHPAMIDAKLVADLEVPLCLLPSKDEPNMDDIFDALSSKPFASKNIQKRFDEMHHGFCAARMDPTDEKQVAAVGDAIDTLIKFYNQC